MSKPAAFIVVKNGQTWLRTSAETEEEIRTGFIMETIPLYTAPQKREPLSDEDLKTIAVEEEFLLFCSEDEFVEIARAIEKAHGIGQ